MNPKAPFFFLLFALPLFADTTAVATWEKYFGKTGNEDEFFSVAAAPAGGYALAGFTDSYGSGRRDAWLVKINEQGDSLWSKTYALGEYAWANAVIATADGGFALNGITYDKSASDTTRNIFLIKTDSLGTVQWTKVYTLPDDNFSNAVRELPDGKFVMAGTTYDSGPDSTWNILVILTDAQGDTQATKIFATPDYRDEAFDVTVTADSGFAVAGDYGGGQGWVGRFDKNGDTLWTKVYAGLYTNKLSSIRQTADGGFIAAGNTNSIGAHVWGYQDVWLVRLNAQGDTLWNRTYGGDNEDKAKSLALLPGGGFVIFADMEYFDSTTQTDYAADHSLLGTDSLGNLRWSSRFGTLDQEYAGGMALSSGGGFVLAGYQYLSSNYTYQAHVLKATLSANTPPVFTTAPDSITTGIVPGGRYLDTLSATDVDNDPLSLQFSLLKKPDSNMTIKVIRDTAAMQSRVAVEWYPTPPDTGHDTIRISVSDGTQSTVLEYVIRIWNILPNSFPRGPQQSFTPGLDYTLSIQLPDSGLSLYITYRPGGSTQWIYPGYIHDYSIPGNYELFIPDSEITERGLVYRVEIEKEGDVFLTQLIGLSPGNISLRQPDTLRVNAFQMIGVPALSPTTSPAAVVGDDLGSADHWKIYGYQNGAMVENPALVPGRGFWLATDAVASLEAQGQTSNPADNFPIALDSGWNMISNPFPFPIFWENAAVKRGVQTFTVTDSFSSLNLVNRRLFTYTDLTGDNAANGQYTDNFDTAQSAYENSYQLKPWAGFWILAEAPGCTLQLSPSGFTPPASKLKTFPASPFEWRLPITLTAGNFSDRAVLGLSPQAAPGYDGFDAPKPPAPTRDLVLGFEHREWKRAAVLYGNDFRNGAAMETSWRLSAWSGKPAVAALQWKIPALEAGRRLYLVDSINGTLLDMQADSAYNFYLEKFQGITVLHTGASLRANNGFPAAFDVKNNFPNPFNPTTAIHFAVPLMKGGLPKVSLKVFSLNGRLVKTLLSQEVRPGYHSVAWDGTDTQGKRSASGIYVQRFEAGHFLKTGKMLLAK